MYFDILRRLRDAVRRKRPEKWRTNSGFLLRVIAKAHLLGLVRDFLAKNNIMIYLSAAVGLTPGGSSTVHIYTQTIRRSGDRIQVETRFSAPIQIGPGAHPASYTTGTGSFQGVMRPDRSVDHPI
jgi:hypothetical protein